MFCYSLQHLQPSITPCVSVGVLIAYRVVYHKGTPPPRGTVRGWLADSPVHHGMARATH
jgi:hypothetical protein